MLTAFVRGCKGSLQKTKKVLEDFNKLGQSCPQIIRNYDPNDQRLVDYLSESLVFNFFFQLTPEYIWKNYSIPD